jgi:hypothetical protein
MAVKKTTMSAEEKAVRDALAAVNADTGVQQAQAIIAGTPFGQAQATVPQDNISDITDPKIRAILEGMSSTATTLSTKLATDASAIGYNANPNTGVVTPNPPTGVQPNTSAADKLTTTNTAAKMDAIAAISALLSSYGLGDLSASVTEAVQKGYSNDTIQLIMQDPNSKDPLAVAFQTRFPANKTRLASGKSVLSASEYLAAERSYTQVLQSYGVSNLATKDKINSFISNDVSASEVADRVGLAINRVQNADADTKAALALYYPSLNQADIIGAVLDPAEGLPALQRKIQIGEIGGAALAQGLKTVDSTGKTIGVDIKMGQEALANLGVTKEQARTGFQTVAEVTPRGEALSNISASGQQYGQLQAEQEAFQGLASAKRARTILTEEEKARFGGSAGTSRGSFSTQYLNKSSSSGQY